MLRLISIVLHLYNELKNKVLRKTGTLYLKVHLSSVKNVSIGKKPTSNGLAFLRFKKGAQVSIGDNFKINNGERFNSIGRQAKCVLMVRRNAELIIGNNVGMSSSAIFCSKKITIGNDVKIGGNVCIYDTDFHALDYSARRSKPIDIECTQTAAVHIGNDVFIGAHSTILKGVSIGDRAIVGAGSVVTKSIPEDEIWAGNPAKFIRNINANDKIQQIRN
jgi:acetyltransferase-like isoleucine patch superfamily enzyme